MVWHYIKDLLQKDPYGTAAAIAMRLRRRQMQLLDGTTAAPFTAPTSKAVVLQPMVAELTVKPDTPRRGRASATDTDGTATSEAEEGATDGATASSARRDTLEGVRQPDSHISGQPGSSTENEAVAHEDVALSDRQAGRQPRASSEDGSDPVQGVTHLGETFSEQPDRQPGRQPDAHVANQHVDALRCSAWLFRGRQPNDPPVSSGRQQDHAPRNRTSAWPSRDRQPGALASPRQGDHAPDGSTWPSLGALPVPRVAARIPQQCVVPLQQRPVAEGHGSEQRASHAGGASSRGHLGVPDSGISLPDEGNTGEEDFDPAEGCVSGETCIVRLAKSNSVPLGGALKGGDLVRLHVFGISASRLHEDGFSVEVRLPQEYFVLTMTHPETGRI